MLQSVESLKKKGDMPVEAESAEDATELHISLTRPIYLQELHLGHFASDIRDTFKSRKRYKKKNVALRCINQLKDVTLVTYSRPTPIDSVIFFSLRHVLKHYFFFGIDSTSTFPVSRVSPTMIKHVRSSVFVWEQVMLR